MKVSKLVLSAMVSSVLFVSSAFSADLNGNGSGSKAAVASVRTQISEVLSDVSTTGEVFVYFSTSAEKGFELVKVVGKDKSLVDLVKNRISTEKIDSPEGLEGSYVVKVSFKTENSFASSFSNEELLRIAVLSAVRDVPAVENTSATVLFSVDGNKLKVIKVSGTNDKVIALIEKSIDNAKVSTSEALAGNYEIRVNF